MTTKDIKAEARHKLALNIHQAIVIYTIEFTLMITLLALIVMSCLCLNSITWIAAVVMICFGILLLLIAIVGLSMVEYAMVDFYVLSYKCKPYNVRRLGDTLARSGMTKIFLLGLKRTLLGFLLLLCLIVPGIIYLLKTSMANYLLVANPKMKASTALSASFKVMSGKTGAYFVLSLSMIGWWLLGFVTLGFGFIFIRPYINLVKVVYYKRNLQGDKTEYSVAGQSVAAFDAANSAPVRTPSDADSHEPADSISVQAVPENVAAPIDGLDDEDFRVMTDAMRDFGSAPEDVNVREVPIPPPAHAHKQGVGENIVSSPIDGTDLVKTERDLSTVEVQEASDILDRKVGEMYSHTDPQPANRDYLSDISQSNANDFVTTEVDGAPIINGGEFVEPVVNDIDTFGGAQAIEEGDPIMSDAQFAEFIREFSTVPEPVHEFKPLQRTRSSASESSGTESAQVQRPARSDRVEHASARAEHREPPVASVRHERNAEGLHAERQRPVAADSDDKAESRAERIRREREERLNKLKKQ